MGNNGEIEPTVRDCAIEVTCSNLAMAGVLQPTGVANYMRKLHTFTDHQLLRVLCYSRLLYDQYIKNDAKVRSS